MKKKDNHGGARLGAGSKAPITKRRVNHTIDIGLADLLKTEANQSALIETLLRKHYKDLLKK
jgi:hypothetical protein